MERKPGASEREGARDSKREGEGVRASRREGARDSPKKEKIKGAEKVQASTVRRDWKICQAGGPGEDSVLGSEGCEGGMVEEIRAAQRTEGCQ